MTQEISNLEAPQRPARTQREQEIVKLGPWFHNLHLPDGTQTAPEHPLGDFPSFKWREIGPHIPQDLTGWRVLDIGCNAGFYTFQLAQRGASVIGIDSEPRYLQQAQWAAAQYGLGDRVRFEQLGLYQLSKLAGTFDLIWFMGVFYHLRYPLLALDLIRRKTSQLLVFQSLSVADEGNNAAPPAPELTLEQREELLRPGHPKLCFIEEKLQGDATNWWVPTASCCEALLRTAGFSEIRKIAPETYLALPLGTPADEDVLERLLVP